MYHVRNARVESLEDGRVSYFAPAHAPGSQALPAPESAAPVAEAENSRGHSFDADTVLIAGGWQPDISLTTPLAQRGIEAHPLGDCRAIGQIEGAIADAGALARAL